MNKKDFVTFARMIRTMKHEVYSMTPTESEHEQVVLKAKNQVIGSLVSELCDIFAESNDRFDKAKFIRECEINR